MTDPKPIPQIPGANGLYPGAHVIVTADLVYRGFRGTLRAMHNPEHVTVDFDSGGIGAFAPAELGILLDSPLAMCHAARWLAGRLGMDPGSTAPRWYRQEECGITIWILEAADGCTMFWTPTERCYLREYAYIQAGKATGVDGISDLTDAAESLAAACVAVGAAPA